MKPLIFAIPFLLLIHLADAAYFPIRGEFRSRHLSGRFARRANITGTSSVSDIGDVQYITDITLGGTKYSVQVDTGSSDLWVVGSVPNAKNTGKSTKVTYAVGEVQGPIMTAPLEFAGYTVTDQAYISATASKENPEGKGLIGLGPNFGSQVSDAIGGRSGDAVLDKIFLQNTSTPNYLTVLLGRSNDPTDPPTGDLTVGEVLPGYEQITSEPHLPVSVVASSNSVNQHWQVLLDADGIVGPAGNNVIDQFNVQTAVDSTSNKKQLTIVIDTGYSLPQVPPDVAKAFYQDVPGARLINREDLSGNIWEIPCDKEINVTFKFGGKSFPIHPLDTVLDLNLTNSIGQHVCVGSFQPMAARSGITYDAIFGMAFLRNAYTYINFGDFVEGNTSITADPYIQLLSTTNDTAESHSDFLKVRGNSPWTPEGASLGDRIRAHLPLVIGLSVGAGILLLAAVIGCMMRRRTKPVAFFRPTYQQLHEPAPEAYSMHPAPGPHQGGPPGYNPSYSSPWDARY